MCGGGVILDTHEAEAQVSQIQGQPRQFSKILSHNKKQWLFVLGTLRGFVMKCLFSPLEYLGLIHSSRREESLVSDVTNPTLWEQRQENHQKF